MLLTWQKNSAYVKETEIRLLKNGSYSYRFKLGELYMSETYQSSSRQIVGFHVYRYSIY